MKNSWKETIKFAFSVFVMTVLLLYIIFQIFMPSMTIKVFRFKPYVVVTASMEPVISVNDIVVNKVFDIEKANEGDIITFLADIDYNGEKEVVTHYIYEIQQNGDSYNIRTNRYFADEQTIVPDTWILTEDDILGSYWFTIPKIGILSDFFRSPFGIATIVFNGAIIGAIIYLIKTDKQDKNNSTE